MPEQLEDIPTMTATERLIEILRGEESTSWQKADAAKEAIEGDGVDRDPRGSVANTGLHARITEVWGEIWDADIPEPPQVRTVGKWYAVARAWPVETRVKGASYKAHQMLAATEWRNRQGILAKMVDRKTARDKDAIVNGDDVRRWKQEQEARKPPTPWEEKFYKRLWSTVHSQTFNIETPAEMKTAIKLIDTLKGDLQNELEEMERDA